MHMSPRQPSLLNRKVAVDGTRFSLFFHSFLIFVFALFCRSCVSFLFFSLVSDGTCDILIVVLHGSQWVCSFSPCILFFPVRNDRGLPVFLRLPSFTQQFVRLDFVAFVSLRITLEWEPHEPHQPLWSTTLPQNNFFSLLPFPSSPPPPPPARICGRRPVVLIFQLGGCLSASVTTDQLSPSITINHSVSDPSWQLLLKGGLSSRMRLSFTTPFSSISFSLASSSAFPQPTETSHATYHSFTTLKDIVVHSSAMSFPPLQPMLLPKKTKNPLPLILVQ